MTEPTAIPCGRCGAPMRETGSASHLTVTVDMQCVHCGAREGLPADLRQRVLALRALRVQRRWAEDAAHGPAIAYLKLMENGSLFLAPYAFGIVMLAATLANARAWNATSALPVGIIGGAGLATLVAWRYLRGYLRRVLGPLIGASPGVPGRPERCRRCGGELPAATGAFATCGYCDAPNLTSGAGLRGHVDATLLYAHQTAAHVTAAGQRVATWFRRAFFVGALGGGGLAYALAAC